MLCPSMFVFILEHVTVLLVLFSIPLRVSFLYSACYFLSVCFSVPVCATPRGGYCTRLFAASPLLNVPPSYLSYYLTTVLNLPLHVFVYVRLRTITNQPASQLATSPCPLQMKYKLTTHRAPLLTKRHEESMLLRFYIKFTE